MSVLESLQECWTEIGAAKVAVEDGAYGDYSGAIDAAVDHYEVAFDIFVRIYGTPNMMDTMRHLLDPFLYSAFCAFCMAGVAADLSEEANASGEKTDQANAMNLLHHAFSQLDDTLMRLIGAQA